MNCIKTGCQVYLAETGQYAWGDAFEMVLDGGPGQLVYVYAFHLCATDYKPINVPVKHFTVHSITHWFDERRTSQDHNSVLLAYSVTDHGYEGVPL